MEMRLSHQQQQHSPHLSPSSHTPSLSSSPSQQPLRHSATITCGFKWVSDHLPQDFSWFFTTQKTENNYSVCKKCEKKIQLSCMQGEDDVPPRPPLPQLYSPDEHPPAVPPLPRETTVIRHTSVRGLKRQSDERKRDREIGQYTNGDSKVRNSDVEAAQTEKSAFSNFCLSVLGGTSAFPERSRADGSWRRLQPHHRSSIRTWRLPDVTQQQRYEDDGASRTDLFNWTLFILSYKNLQHLALL